MARKASSPVPFPSRDDVLAFIRESPAPVGTREIARAFRLTGSDRLALKALIADLEDEGALERGRGRRVAPPRHLPEVVMVELTGEADEDGCQPARPLGWRDDDPPPKILVDPDRQGRAGALGDRVLARTRRVSDGLYRARVMRRIDGDSGRVVGVLRAGPHGPRVVPCDRRSRTEYLLDAADAARAAPGELVVCDILPGRRLGLGRARLVEPLGRGDSPRAIALIAVARHGLPSVFAADALAEAARAAPPTPGDRHDLRDLPLVTIDGADARDFDDAVWAAPDPDPANPGGWQLVVAIADVAHYVRPDSALDRAARDRGNAVYFPDRVIPMLPEALSNGLCSLKPDEDRLCLAVHLYLAADGTKIAHRFSRAVMRSAARLTYDQVQAALDGDRAGAALPAGLEHAVIAHLGGAYRALAAARDRRGPLELDLPERVVALDDQGAVTAVATRPRTDSHRLIETFMIAANVAAAETLEARGMACLYRVHDQPAPDKIDQLAEILAAVGIRLARDQAARPAMFNRVLAQTRARGDAVVISEAILRAQAQAVYSPDNIGHFGLALARYAHFTSPIRRYADLVVHRALIRALGFGPDGLDDAARARLAELGDHISMTERRAATAEREVVDRYLISFLAARTGAELSGRIGGATRAGLFVRLDETGADGLVPIGTLPDDRYDHDPVHQCLVGRHRGLTFRPGGRVVVRLDEADYQTGRLTLTLVAWDDAQPPPPPDPHRRAGRRTARAGRLHARTARCAAATGRRR